MFEHILTFYALKLYYIRTGTDESAKLWATMSDYTTQIEEAGR